MTKKTPKIDFWRQYYNAVRQQLAVRFAPQHRARVLELFSNTARDQMRWERQGAASYVLMDKDYDKNTVAADSWYTNVLQKRSSERSMHESDVLSSVRWQPVSSMSTRYITVDCFCAGADFSGALSLASENGRPFDVICAYAPALPMAFESEHKLKALLQNIADNLNVGGYTIFTFPCTHRLTRWYENATHISASDGTVGNSLVRFRLDCRFDRGFANQYEYGEKSPETATISRKTWFLVDEQMLSRLATSLFSMSVILSAPFENIVDTSALDDVTRDSAWLWRAVVFQKQ